MTGSVGEDDNTTPENKPSDPSSTVPAPSETGKHLHSIIHCLDVIKVKNIKHILTTEHTEC